MSNDVPVYTVKELLPRRSRYAVLIPVWNEGERIRLQLERMQKVKDFPDIILADGNSDDGSLNDRMLNQLGVRCLLATEERGLGTALRMGFDYLLQQGYEGVITVDGNGKDSVEDVPQFISLLDQGYDFIQGSRFMRPGDAQNTPIDRLLSIKLCIVPLMRIASGFPFTDPTNGFKGISRRYLAHEELQILRKIFVRFNLQFYLNFRAPFLASRIIEIPVQRIYPKDLPTPTKIHGVGTRFVLLKEFIATLIRCYNPARVTRQAREN